MVDLDPLADGYDAVPHRSSVGQLGRMEDATARHNLRIIQSDPRLQRILTRYRCMSESEKDQFLRLVEELK